MTGTIGRCTKCITPLSLPGVSVDADGVCNHCRTHERLFAHWDSQKKKKQQELDKIVTQVKSLNRKYDCLISLSGGKDSTYALYLFSKIYKMKCLCVTFDNGLMSDHAKANIKSAIEITKSDHIYYAVSRKTTLDLFHSSVQKCGSFCAICLRGIVMSAEVPLKQFNIPMQVAGTGRRVSYLSFIPELYQGGDPHFLKKLFKDDISEKEIQPFLINPVSWYFDKIRKLVKGILGLSNRDDFRIELYDYFDYSHRDIHSIITNEMNWITPDEKYEHMDCRVSSISDYIMTIKFPELTALTLYHSSLIRLGAMTRAEALVLESQAMNRPQEPLELNDFLYEINMTKEEFVCSVKNWRNIEKYRSKKRSIVRTLYRMIVKN